MISYCVHVPAGPPCAECVADDAVQDFFDTLTPRRAGDRAAHEPLRLSVAPERHDPDPAASLAPPPGDGRGVTQVEPDPLEDWTETEKRYAWGGR